MSRVSSLRANFESTIRENKATGVASQSYLTNSVGKSPSASILKSPSSSKLNAGSSHSRIPLDAPRTPTSPTKSVLRRKSASSKSPKPPSTPTSPRVQFVARKGKDDRPVLPQRKRSVRRLDLDSDDDALTVDTDLLTVSVASSSPKQPTNRRNKEEPLPSLGLPETVPCTVEIIDKALHITDEKEKLKPALKSSAESRWS